MNINQYSVCVCMCVRVCVCVRVFVCVKTGMCSAASYFVWHTVPPQISVLIPNIMETFGLGLSLA